MRINRNKLPMKYALEIYQEIPGYPSHTDLEYILISTLQDKDLLGKEFTADQVWDSFKHCLGTIKDLQGFLDYAFQPDDERDRHLMASQGTKPTSNTYQLHDHAWSSWS